MRKWLAIFLCALLICLCSCNHSNLSTGKPLSFEGLTVTSSGTADYMVYEHFSTLRQRYRLEKTIVFRGVKEGLSTPIQTYREDGSEGVSYCETNLRVLEVFYGDIQVDDIISHREWISIADQDGITYLQTIDGAPPIAEKEEYVFILSKHNEKNSEGNDLYDTYSMHHSYHKIADYEDFKAKVHDGTATMRENFGFEVMDYYLNQPDTALDLPLEASKYVDGLSENATEEEILQALPEEQKSIFESMIEQYGTK